MRITGFGESSMCLTEAQIGDKRLAFLDTEDLTTTPPTYKLVYSDLWTGAIPATPDDLADAQSAVMPDDVGKNEHACWFAREQLPPPA
jgi:hypothetical protein